jgi:hypothetical protein
MKPGDHIPGDGPVRRVALACQQVERSGRILLRFSSGLPRVRRVASTFWQAKSSGGISRRVSQRVAARQAFCVYLLAS